MAIADRDCLTEHEASALAAGETSDALLAREAHLDHCADCRELVALLTRALVPEDAGDEPRVRPSQRIGRFEIREPLGAGGMGVVFEARDATLDRRVALKFVHVDGGDDPALAQARLVRESRALARLNHPNVVTLYDVGIHGDEIYLAMELVEGTTVAAWLRQAPRTYREVLDVFVQACRGLEAAHDAGLIHRDIKPTNILVGDDGRIRVGDFGLVREHDAPPEPAPGTTEDLDDPLTRPNTVLGTPRYMAPELLRGASATPRSDQWSFAATLWEALYEVPAGMRIGGDAPAISRDGRRVPARTRRVLRRALSPSPADRFGSLGELRTALVGHTRRVVWIAGGAAAIAGLGVLAGSLAAHPADPDPCAAVDDALAGVWDPSRREALERTFAATGAAYAPVLATSVAHVLDRQAADAVRVRRDACRGEVPAGVALQLACLDNHRAMLDATVGELLRTTAAALPHALDLVRDLPLADACANLESLAHRQPLPVDPVARLQVAALARELDHDEVTFKRTRDAGMLPRVDQIAGLGESRDFAPLRARALQLAAAIRYSRLDPTTAATLHQAILAAEQAGDDLLQAQLAITLYGSAAFAPMPAADLASLYEHTDARLTGLARTAPRLASRLRWYLLGNRGNVELARDPEAALHSLTSALALGDQVFGPASLEQAEGRRSLVVAYLRTGEFARALAETAALVDQTAALLGAQHPDMAAVHDLAAAAYHFNGREPEALAEIRAARAIAEPVASPPARAALIDLEADIVTTDGDLAAGAGLLAQALALGGPGDPLRTRLDCTRRALATGATTLADLDRTASPAQRLDIATCFLDARRSQIAVPILERALARSGETAPRDALEVRTRFAFARALADRGRDPERARREATRARRECTRIPGGSALAREIDAWLADAAKSTQ